MLTWHVVLCRPQQEHRAAVELAQQDFRVFLPVLYSKPMFPRYIFTQFNRDRDNWGVIKSTRGCVDLLKNGFLPAHVPQNAMDAIMSYRPPIEEIPADAQFTTGQPVRIVDGVLAGLDGLFQRDAKGRSMALLEVLGRRVELPRDSIRAA